MTDYKKKMKHEKKTEESGQKKPWKACSAEVGAQQWPCTKLTEIESAPNVDHR